MAVTFHRVLIDQNDAVATERVGDIRNRKARDQLKESRESHVQGQAAAH